MPNYSGTFTNKTGTYPIVIINDYRNFHFELGRFKFSGFDLDSFELTNPEAFTLQELYDFDLLPRPVDEKAYIELSKYQLNLEIPIVLIEPANERELTVMVDFQFELKEKSEYALLTIEIENEKYLAKNGFMELILDDLQRQFKGKYRFKNCYGCMYGDYSVYGQGFMGPVLCFKNQKEAYLKVQNKTEYMELKEQESTQQELFCCDEYQLRDRELGYRGTIL